MKITVLIISYKSIAKLEKCLSTIGKNNEIIIIENSDNSELKDTIEKKYKNCKVIINNNNLGYGAAANIGFKEINSQFALLLNTDTIINETQIKEIENEILNSGDDFALASPIYDDLIDFSKNNEFDKNLTKVELNYDEKNNRTKVEVIKGCSLIINFNKFQNKQLFDDNYFFFYEEIDLCKRVKDMSKNIYVFNKVKITHGSNCTINSDADLYYGDFRNWNYYWSSFYYHKKHHGYFYSFLMHSSKLIRFFISFIILYFFSKEKFRKNKFRFFGLFSSIVGIKSSVSKYILNKN